MAFKRLLVIHNTVVNRLFLLAIENPDGTTETLHATEQHPFWVADPAYGPEGGMWVRAGLLTPGMTLLDDQGNAVRLLSVGAELLPTGVQVYNLEVKDAHTYFVLDDSGVPVWVHNGKLCNLNSNAARSQFGVYTIRIDKVVFKIGKADFNRITHSTKLPTRVHQQVRKLESIFGKGAVKVELQRLGVVTSKTAKSFKTLALQKHFELTGFVPLGNWKSFVPRIF